MSYSFVCQLKPTRFIDGEWRILPSSILTDPRNERDWLRLFPLRIHIISDKNLKAGVAQNAKEFCDIMKALSVKAKIPYGQGKRAEMERGLKPMRHNATTRNVAEIFGQNSK